MPTIEEIRSRFAADRYATEVTGVQILEAQPGRAVCSLPLRPELMNANHAPMGGAIFTLADLAFAVAVNAHSDSVTVSRQVSITYLSPAKGQTLTAEARCLKAGRRTCLYEVEVTDEAGTYVAHAAINGFTTGPAVEKPQNRS